MCPLLFFLIQYHVLKQQPSEPHRSAKTFEIRAPYPVLLLPQGTFSAFSTALIPAVILV